MANQSDQGQGQGGGTMQAAGTQQQAQGINQPDFNVLQQRFKAATTALDSHRYLIPMLNRRANWDSAQISSFLGLPLDMVDSCLQSYATGGADQLANWRWQGGGGGSGQGSQSR